MNFKENDLMLYLVFMTLTLPLKQICIWNNSKVLRPYNLEKSDNKIRIDNFFNREVH